MGETQVFCINPKETPLQKLADLELRRRGLLLELAEVVCEMDLLQQKMKVLGIVIPWVNRSISTAGRARK